jgi:hypothetical protein
MATKRKKNKAAKLPKSVSPLRAAQKLASREACGVAREVMNGTNIARPVSIDMPQIIEELSLCAGDIAAEAIRLKAEVITRNSRRSKPSKQSTNRAISRGFVILGKQINGLSNFFKRIELLEDYRDILAKS